MDGTQQIFKNIALTQWLPLHIRIVRHCPVPDPVPEKRPFPIPHIFATALSVKAVVLLLESQSKSKWYLKTTRSRGAEECSGLFSLCTFSWLTSLIVRGHQTILGLENLPTLEPSLTAAHQQLRFEKAWRSSSRHGRKRLLSALATSAGTRGLYPVLPRIALIGFTFCQPLLIQGISQYLQNPPIAASTNFGYGWIGATFFAYSGMAVTSSVYWYNHERVLTRLRTDLVDSIFRQTTGLSHSYGDKSNTLTLMSTDIERIQRGLYALHEVWANAIEVGLAAWLLHEQIGVAFLVPLAYIALCVGLSLALGKFSMERQGEWMIATQRRVGTLSKIIPGMKSLRMLGLSAQLVDTVDQQRDAELHCANRSRLILILAAVLGFSPLLLTPVLTFAATGLLPDTSRLFASLALLLLVANSLTQLLQVMPQLISTLACFDRVADFLETAPCVDGREFQPAHHLERVASCVKSTTCNFEAWEKEETTDCECNTSCIFHPRLMLTL